MLSSSDSRARRRSMASSLSTVASRMDDRLRLRGGMVKPGRVSEGGVEGGASVRRMLSSSPSDTKIGVPSAACASVTPFTNCPFNGEALSLASASLDTPSGVLGLVMVMLYSVSKTPPYLLSLNLCGVAPVSATEPSGSESVGLGDGVSSALAAATCAASRWSALRPCPANFPT